MPDGRLDPTFGEGGRATLQVAAPGRVYFGGLAALADGGVAVAATVHDRDPDQRLIVWRLRADGRLDRTFADEGVYLDPHPGAGNAIAARADGGLIIGGQTGSYYGFAGRELLLALTSDGRVDAAWATGGRFVGPPGAEVRSVVVAPDGGVVAMDWLPSQASVLWLTKDGARREQWGLDGRAALGERATRYYTTGIALDRAGRVYVAHAVFYDRSDERQEVAAVSRVTEAGALDRWFGRNGTARVPVTKSTRRSAAEAVAIGPGDRVYLAASGASELQGFREDFDYTHGLVARFKAYPPFAGLGDVIGAAGRRRATVAVGCSLACRATVAITDRRDRRLGRATGTVRPGATRTFRLRLNRRLRLRERVTVRLIARESVAGREDVVVLRHRVRRATR